MHWWCFFFPVGGTYFPFTVLLSHMDSIDLIYISIFANIRQKRASSCSQRNFPQPLPKLKTSDKSKPREGGWRFWSTRGKSCSSADSRKQGRVCFCLGSGQVLSTQSCGEGKGEQIYWTNLWRGSTCMPASQGLICWQASERGSMSNALPQVGTRAVTPDLPRSEKRNAPFSLQTIFQQP